MTSPLRRLIPALFFGALAPAFAGDLLSSAPKEIPPLLMAPSLLCFADGALCFDLDERVRYEARSNNFDFDRTVHSPNDGSWLLTRFRLGMTIKPVSWLKFYAQGQDSRENFSDRPHFPGTLGAEGQDPFDLRQAYVALGDPKLFPLTLTVGRQILSYGDERLVGPTDWNNLSRTFDAVRFRYEQPHWWLEAFTSSVVVMNRHEFDKSDLFDGNDLHRDLVFSGVYYSNSTLRATTLDAYAFLLDEKNGNDANQEGLLTLPRAGAAPAQGGDPTRRSDFLTYGSRLKLDPKALGGFEFDAEAAGQIGKVSGLDLRAAAVHAGVGYNFYNVWAQPRLYAEYSYASGDTNPRDREDNTFQNLFPSNHRFYGYMDLFSWQNLHNPNIELRFTPLPKVTVQLDGEFFFAATNEDAWYRSNGLTRVRPIAPNADLYEGAEFDLTLIYQPIKNVSVQAGYSHFAAGDFLQASGRADNADFGYVMLTLTY